MKKLLALALILLPPGESNHQKGPVQNRNRALFPWLNQG